MLFLLYYCELCIIVSKFGHFSMPMMHFNIHLLPQVMAKNETRPVSDVSKHNIYYIFEKVRVLVLEKVWVL